MRTPLLTISFGLSLLTACEVGDLGGGGDDDNGGAICGDTVKEGTEACDDGNTASGDGCSATCQVEVVPKLDVAVDKLTINTELGTTHMLTVTLIASGGFSGPVNLAGSAITAGGLPLSGWTVTFDTPTVNMPVDGTFNAVATVKVPTENKGLTGTIKLDASSSLGMKSSMASVNVMNQLTIDMTLNGQGTCAYPAAGTVRVTTGSTIRFLNKTNRNITIHMQGAGGPDTGLDHQPDPGSPPNMAYTQVLAATVNNVSTVGGRTSWYCHAPGPTVNNLILEAVAP